MDDKEEFPELLKFSPEGSSKEIQITTTWQVWSEGYLCSGMEGIPQRAIFHGDFIGDTFKDAVIACRDSFDDENSRNCVDIENLSFWVCRFFDNEADARKAFG